MPEDDEDQKKIAADFFKGLDEDPERNRMKQQQQQQKTQEEIDAEKKANEEKKAEEDRLAAERAKLEEEPLFQKKGKSKPSKDESVEILRKQRDEAIEKNKIFTETFAENDPKAIKPLVDFVMEGANGPLTQEAVVQRLESFKAAQQTIDDLQRQLSEKEQKVADLDIRHSDEFKQGFQKPYEEAMQTLFLEFATIAPDKTIIAPNATKKFNDFLLSNPDVDGITVKQKLIDFRNEFKAETGEDPTLPSVTSLMGSLRLFNSKRGELQNAYKNWQTKKAEEAKRQQFQAEQQPEAQKKANKRARVQLASKAFQEFDIEQTPFIDDKKLESLFKDEFSFGERIYEGDDIPEWDEMMTRGVKSRLWDEYLPRLIELMSFKEEVEKGNRNHLHGKGVQPNTNNFQQGKVDWLGEPMKK